MVYQWYPDFRGSSVRSSYDLVWSETINNRNSTYFGKLMQLYTPIFYQLIKHCYGHWNTFNSTSKMASQIFYSKLKWKDKYPSAYICEIWHYSRAETDLINRAIESSLHFYTSKLYSFQQKKILQTITSTERKNWLYQRQRNSGNLWLCYVKSYYKRYIKYS